LPDKRKKQCLRTKRGGRRWRTRTRGSPRQIGQHFVVDDESLQAKKSRLPKVEESKQSRLRRIFSRQFDAEEREKEKQRKRLRELKERKQMYGIPIEEPKQPKLLVLGDEIVELPDADQLREEIEPVVEEIKVEFKPLSQILRESRFTQWLNRPRPLRNPFKKEETVANEET
jgi:hypothetical protein